VVSLVIERGEGEGLDDDEEQQGADSESPEGMVVPHDEDFGAIYVDALIAIPPLTAYHRRKPLRHVQNSDDAPRGTSPTVSNGMKAMPNPCRFPSL
jgi:hypothetical protein